MRCCGSANKLFEGEEEEAGGPLDSYLSSHSH
jgi:hypothetical protein